MANPGGLDLDQDFPGLRSVELHLLDRERRLGLMRDSGSYIHEILPLVDENESERDLPT